MATAKNQFSLQWVIYSLAIWLIVSGTMKETPLSDKKLTLGAVLLLSGKAIKTEKIDQSLNQTLFDVLQKIEEAEEEEETKETKQDKEE